MLGELLDLSLSANQTCHHFLNQCIKSETLTSGDVIIGWHHFIDDANIALVGPVATAQTLILAKLYTWQLGNENRGFINSLLRLQSDDGGWRYKTNITNLSAIEPTAWSLIALVMSEDKSALTSIEDGVGWLLTARNTDGLWGPLPCAASRTYYSCLALIALDCAYKTLSLSPQITSSVDQVIISAKKLLFTLADGRSGWGLDLNGSATTFHSAFVLITLSILADNHYTYAKGKAYEVVQSSLAASNFSGGQEEYQYGDRRLTHYNSARLYAYLAKRLYRLDNLADEAQLYYLLSCLKDASEGKWHYEGKNVSWRLFDVMIYSYVLSKDIEPLLIESEERNMNAKRFSVALSFSGEVRDYARTIADFLSLTYGSERILFDEYHSAEFNRPNQDLYLQTLYRQESELVVFLFSPTYAENPWCGLEWKAMRDLMNQRKTNLAFIKTGAIPFDIPGLFDTTDGFIYTSHHPAEKIAEMIVMRHDQLA